MRSRSPSETLSVDPSSAGQRLDQWLAAHVPALSRARAQRLIQQGAVSVSGRRARKGDLVQSGQIIQVVDLLEAAAANAALPLAVRLETPQLVVVAKPAGQPTAPLKPGELDTLANALLARYPEMAGIGYHPREPGLLQRLDTWTSGLLVAARTTACFDVLRGALSERRLTKKYLAVVSGALPAAQGRIETTLAPHPGDRRRVMLLPGSTGKHLTAWHKLESHGPWTLLEVEASRAYRHQVRAHLAALGCPIAGDAIYGGRPAAALGQRHALHASYVAWSGNRELAGFAVTEPLPEAMGILMAED